MKVKNKIIIRERILYFFSPSYITLLNIVQAAVLGFLLYEFKEMLRNGFPCPLYILIVISTFFVIIEVWHEYMMGAAVFRWIPSIADTIIPFSLGVAQFLMITSITLRKIAWWYFSLSIACFISCWAYVNMYQKVKSRLIPKSFYEINKIILKSLKQFPKFNEISIFILGIFFLFFGLYQDKYPYCFAIISLIILILFIIRGCFFYWGRIIK